MVPVLGPCRRVFAGVTGVTKFPVLMRLIHANGCDARLVISLHTVPREQINLVGAWWFVDGPTGLRMVKRALVMLTQDGFCRFNHALMVGRPESVFFCVDALCGFLGNLFEARELVLGPKALAQITFKREAVGFPHCVFCG
ncbi:hypothetical protein [Roseobacter cerasinus]|uniref:hypothetical protein n=1 Tax=Roseobacter cerasinus TaxID=2602289 RepID=UPI00135CB262|nr:hypothetical protein [Roseobacter cerasinus]